MHIRCGIFVLYKAFTIVLIATCGYRSIFWCKIESIIAFSANFVSVMSPLFGAATKDNYLRYRWKAGAISHSNTQYLLFSKWVKLLKFSYNSPNVYPVVFDGLCIQFIEKLFTQIAEEISAAFFLLPIITQPFERWGIFTCSLKKNLSETQRYCM